MAGTENGYTVQLGPDFQDPFNDSANHMYIHVYTCTRTYAVEPR